MKKRLLPIVARLTALSLLIVLFGTVTADADNADYFNGFYACDSGYYPDLQECRQSGLYTESQCRYIAARKWEYCLSSVYPYAPEEPDFCVDARNAQYHCDTMYSLGGIDPDLSIWMACSAGTGIENCE